MLLNILAVLMLNKLFIMSSEDLRNLSYIEHNKPTVEIKISPNSIIISVLENRSCSFHRKEYNVVRTWQVVVVIA